MPFINKYITNVMGTIFPHTISKPFPLENNTFGVKLFVGKNEVAGEMIYSQKSRHLHVDWIENKTHTEEWKQQFPIEKTNLNNIGSRLLSHAVTLSYYAGTKGRLQLESTGVSAPVYHKFGMRKLLVLPEDLLNLITSYYFVESDSEKLILKKTIRHSAFYSILKKNAQIVLAQQLPHLSEEEIGKLTGSVDVVIEYGIESPNHFLFDKFMQGRSKVSSEKIHLLGMQGTWYLPNRTLHCFLHPSTPLAQTYFFNHPMMKKASNEQSELAVINNTSGTDKYMTTHTP